MSDLFFFRDDEMIYRAKAKPWKAPKANAHVDPFSMSYSSIVADEMTDAEIGQYAGSTLVFDTEVFSNYFLTAFRHLDTGKVITLECHNRTNLMAPKLQWVLEHYCIIGYNSRNYDIPINQLAIKGASAKELFEASLDIIKFDMREYDFRKKYKLKDPTFDHIDLIEVAPLVGSLKKYAGRLHTARMQDLPVDPYKPLEPEQKAKVREYCINDLDSTALLVTELEPALTLRCQMSAQYSVDLRSKSDAQIAEAVIVSELTKESGIKPKRPDSVHESHKYRVPSFVSYRSPQLQHMLEIVRNAIFRLDAQGYIELPDEIKALKLAIGQCVYQMGAGGLHSTEKTVAHKADDEYILIDRDVVSYYPSIILNQRLFPKHLGEAFLRVYRSIVERRLKAKKDAKEAKDEIKALEKVEPQTGIEGRDQAAKEAQANWRRSSDYKNRISNLIAKVKAASIVADSLKITINGSFGKLGSRWSALYSPDLMIQVTVTGQIALLMLIEMIEDLGISVVSANTDGVLIKCPRLRQGELQERISWWERLTGFETEETRYKAVYARDVNNYLAVKESGDPKAKYLDERLGVKAKGCYGERGSAGNSVLSKNPENLICNDAVMQLIATGKPIEETIRECQDIRRFVTIRDVTGGARKSDVYLGKVIRWYFSTEMQGEINRATKGDKIPNTDGAKPLMELPSELPKDIDYNRYIDIAIDTLFDIGYYTGLRKASKRCTAPLFFENEQAAYNLNK